MIKLWVSTTGKLHLPGEDDRTRCGLLLSVWDETTGTLSDVTCSWCKNAACEPPVEEHSQEPDPEPDPGREPETPPVFGEEGPRLCWCGCGRPVKGKKARFVPGHDARLYALIRKIEKGEVDEDAIPEELRRQMTHCRCCGKPILPHESGMGPLCRAGKCRCRK